MERNDIKGEPRAPESITKYLLLKGGRNIYDEPNFRLVHVTTRMTQRGGRWQDWDKNLTAQERGGVIRLASGLVIPSHYRPDRVRIEVRMVRKYCLEEGWLLERWVPQAYYGSQEAWAARAVPLSDEPGAPLSDVPFGGPFPVHGDYEMCHLSPTKEIPSITELQNAMDRSFRAQEHAMRASVQQIVLERIHEAEEQYEKDREAERLESEARMRDLLTPLASTSLAAGRWRTQLAGRAGHRGHVGN